MSLSLAYRPPSLFCERRDWTPSPPPSQKGGSCFSKKGCVEGWEFPPEKGKTEGFGVLLKREWLKKFCHFHIFVVITF